MKAVSPRGEAAFLQTEDLNMAEKRIVPIVFSSNDDYVPPLSVALQSIMENSDTERNEYRFFILQQDVTDANQELLRAQIGGFAGCSLDIIDVTKYVEGLTFQNLNYSVAAYFRLLAPYLLGEYEQVIYLDCDTVCCADIALLLDYEYGGYVMGAAPRAISNDPDYAGWAWLREYPQSLGLSDYRDYFNSGVMVINTKMFADMISRDDLLEMAVTDTYLFADQDILNVLCEGRVAWFPMKWNSMLHEEIPGISGEQFPEYHEALTNPCIIHFNADKPWKKNTGTERQKRFWDYAERTPFADVLRAMLQETEARLAAPIDPDKDEAIFFSNNLRETEAAESQLKGRGIETKRGSGAENCAFNVYVAKDDVEEALGVLME
jgi:lipopolysaccharide biosynthesis glycosyltransferase